MSDIAFDALSAARDLEAVGLDRKQAETIADTMRRAVVADGYTFATKADIARLEDKMATKTDLAAVKDDITALKWAFGFVAALNVAMAARLFGAI